MTDEQKKLKEHFLEPEVRDGVYVSAELKSVWKVLLDILEEIQRVCKKYDLEYTLEGGSLLGAMRHKGFIPWDDDIDVVVPRKDYDKLLNVLPRELPSYYECQSTRTVRDFHIPHIMIRDSRTTGIDYTHIKYGKTFNMGIRVDVLALDGMPRFGWVRWLIRWYCIVLGYAVPRARFDYKTARARQWVWHGFGVVMMKLFRPRGIYWLRESPFRLFQMKRCKWCGSLAARNFWHPHSIRRSDWFNEYMDVPFEYLTIPVPRDYDKILTQQFQDWRTPVKGGSYHGKLIFDVKKDWKTTLIENYGYEESDFKHK